MKKSKNQKNNWYEELVNSKEYAPYYFRPTNFEDIETLYENIRSEEILEAWHLHRLSVEDVLVQSLEWGKKEGSFIFTLCHNDTVLGIGGLSPLPIMNNAMAEIWFLGMDFQEHKKFAVHHAKNIIKKINQEYPILFNIVGAWNTQSINWLRHMGFCVEEATQAMGKNNAPFHRFYLTL